MAASAIHANTAAVSLPCRLKDIFDFYEVILFNVGVLCYLKQSGLSFQAIVICF